MDKLTGLDYITKPLIELQSHSDFSMAAFNKLSYISRMYNDQIEMIDLEDSFITWSENQ